MVASFRGSGVGEEPREIAIFVRFKVLCAVLLLFLSPLTQLSERLSTFAADASDSSYVKFVIPPGRGGRPREAGTGIVRIRIIVRIRSGAPVCCDLAVSCRPETVPAGGARPRPRCLAFPAAGRCGLAAWARAAR